MPAESFMETILRRGYLKAGVSGDTFGFGYVDPKTLTLQGFDVEVLQQIAMAIFGRADSTVLHLIPITIPQVAAAITSGEVDIVAHTMTITCARRAELDFSSEYLVAHQRLLVGAGSGITSLAQLSGKRVCAAAGTTSLANIKLKAPGAIPVPVASETDCLVQFQTGQVDAVSTDDTILDGMAKQDPYSHVVGPALSDEPYGLAVSLAHRDFTQFVNGVLARILSGGSEGTLAYLYSQALNTTAADVPLPQLPLAYRD
jgi:polar amino acid transport system substrate-binding protein